MEHEENQLLGYHTVWGRPGGLIHIARVVALGGRWYVARPICGRMDGVALPSEPTVGSKDAKDLKLQPMASRTPCSHCVKRAQRAEAAE